MSVYYITELPPVSGHRTENVGDLARRIAQDVARQEAAFNAPTGNLVSSSSTGAHVNRQDRPEPTPEQAALLQKQLDAVREDRHFRRRAAVQKEARRLALAAGPGRMDPATVVEGSEMLQGIIKKFAEDVRSGALMIEDVKRARLEAAIDEACGRSSKSKSKSKPKLTPAPASTSALGPSSSTAQPATDNTGRTIFDSVLNFFGGKRKRSEDDDDEDGNEGRAKKRCLQGPSGVDLDMLTMPGAYPEEPPVVISLVNPWLPSPRPSSSWRPIAGSARAGKAKAALPSESTGVKQAIERLDDELMAYMIDQILNN